MPEIFSKWFEKFKEFWSSLEKSQKNRIYITTAIAAAIVFIGLYAVTRPTYTTLVSNADPKEVGEMTDILKKNNIWHKVESEGRKIIVNQQDNNKAQVVLAQAGYPKGGMTFEDAISMINMGTTESDKKQIWKKQQVSDIEQKIMMLDNIELATVNLALPERNIFVSDDQKLQKPTAYVMVKPKQPLTKKQIQGIVMIVSRSVENLEPQNVTVIDNNSNILNAGFEEDDYSIASTQEEIRAKREKELEEKVRDYFSVGQFDSFDTFRVVANVVLDFDKEKVQSKELYNPEGMDQGALISSDSLKEKIENAGNNGVPGTDTNPGNANSPTYQFGGSSNSNYSKQHDIKNFEYTQVLRDKEKAIGMMVPSKSSLAISIWYGRNVTDDSKLTDDFIEQVRVAASTATGIPKENISVKKYRLAAAEQNEPSFAQRFSEFMSKNGVYIVLILILISMLAITLLMGRDKKDLQPAIAEAAASRFAVPQPPEPVPEIDLEEKSEIKKQIEKFVSQKPEAVAQLLRNWLSDDWES